MTIRAWHCLEWMARSDGRASRPSRIAAPVRYYAGKCGRCSRGASNKLLAWGGAKVMLLSGSSHERRTPLVERHPAGRISFSVTRRLPLTLLAAEARRLVVWLPGRYVTTCCKSSRR
jgi:hypothetical protein